MIRGLYTGAAGMTANQHRMDTIANNLANVNKTAFKRDTVIFKSFPELLLHRTNDNGVGWMPMGSFDISPLVGKLGTGTEVNEIFTRFKQGAVRKTDKDADLALNGKGFMTVQTDRGERLTRNGAFILNKDGMLVNHQGFPLMGENGPIKVARNNFIVKPNGEVWINGDNGNDPKNFTGRDMNQWKDPIMLDKLKIVTVDFPRHLYKDGDSFYSTTPESGDARAFNNTDKVPQGEILQGFLETSNVNIVREMVSMIEVQRSYELNQKAISTHDTMLGALINQVPK